MGFELSVLAGRGSHVLVQKQIVNAVLACNEMTVQYGLALTEQQAMALLETRTHALKETGRIEFGAGIIDKIIVAFCDSPYLGTYNYEETLHRLLDIFYYYKNETMDAVSDDDLIAYMKQSYDGICQGSLALLAGRELDQFARRLRGGYADEDMEDEVDPDEDMEDEDAWN